MKVINGVSELHQAFHNTAITIGNFDGLHLGHKEILRRLQEEAKKINGKAIVLTFEPHPSEILTPQKSILRINTIKEKTALIKNQNIDALIMEPFTKELASTTAEDFFNKILVQKLNPKVIVIGHDFHFGKNREGSIDTLKKFGEKIGIEVIKVHPFEKDEEIISSSLIRKYIDCGNVEKAHTLLGRPFFLGGTVIKGAGRGKEMKTPTANLAIENRLIPGDGVYILMTYVDNALYPSVGSVGINVTFDSTGPRSIETHILNFVGDLHNKHLILHYLKKIRDMKKFPSMEALKKEMGNDVAIAKKFFDL